MDLISQKHQKLTDLLIKAAFITPLIDPRTQHLGIENLQQIESQQDGPFDPLIPPRLGVALHALAVCVEDQAAVGESSAISASSSPLSTR